MLVREAMMAARTHLNDDDAINWPDPNIFPKMQEAYRVLQLELTSRGMQYVKNVSQILTVPAGTTDLTTVTNYPTDLISPIWLKEKLPNEAVGFFVDMVPVDFIPQVQQDIHLTWWTWQRNKILVLGALNDVNVQIRYERTLTVPTANTDDIGIYLGEVYLTYKTAALCFGAAKDYKGRDEMERQAMENLDKLLQFNTTRDMQKLPAKRRAYHRRFGQRDLVRTV